MKILNLNEINTPTKIVLITQEPHYMRIILHWNKLINNKNIKFYYDYVENSSWNYEEFISKSELIDLLKNQIEKTQKLIEKNEYIDIDIGQDLELLSIGRKK